MPGSLSSPSDKGALCLRASRLVLVRLYSSSTTWSNDSSLPTGEESVDSSEIMLDFHTARSQWESGIGGMERWNRAVEWNTGMKYWNTVFSTHVYGVIFLVLAVECQNGSRARMAQPAEPAKI